MLTDWRKAGILSALALVAALAFAHVSGDSSLLWWASRICLVFGLVFFGGALSSFLISDAARRLVDTFISKTSRLSEAQSGNTKSLDGTTSELIPELQSVFNECDLLAKRYELIATNVAASIVLRDLEEKTLFCSPYTEVLTGYSMDEIYSTDEDFFSSVALEDDRERYLRAYHVSRLGEDMLVRYQIRHRKGFKMWLETRMVPVCKPDGEVEAVMSVTVDVTDSLSYQKQIEAQNRDLSDFAYMVSHDLKAPIFTIKGMASALYEDHGEALGEDAKELMDYILQGAHRLEKLVESVIEYSSISTKELPETDIDLNAVLSDVLQDLSEQIRQTNAEIQVADNLPTIRASQVRMYQLFSNLIGNALKYRSPDRPPAISVRCRDLSSDPMIVDVIDNGLGIPADRIDDIFRPYRRAHGNEIEGSGIGLACVKKIVELIGGSVSASSVEGSGSTFTVAIPSPSPQPQAIPKDLERVFQ